MRIQEYGSTSGFSDQEIQKDVARVSGLTWAALQRRHVRVGMFPSGLGVIIYQMEGNTLLCCGDLVELCSARNHSFAEMMKSDSVAANTDYKELIEESNCGV